MIDEHPAVDGHGATNRHVFRQRSHNGREVSCQEAFDGVAARFESLPVRLVNEGFRNEFGQGAESGDGVGGSNVSHFLLCFEGFEG